MRCVFEKVFLCNDSHLYKNAYKVFSFENVSKWKCECIKCFCYEQVTKINLPTQKVLDVFFHPPLDVATLPLI